MKNLTVTFDLKSICMGALGVICVVSLSNFNKVDQHRNDPADEVRRYQTFAGERETIVLDTKTGKFLVHTGYTRWQKGDFTTMQNDKVPKTE